MHCRMSTERAASRRRKMIAKAKVSDREEVCVDVEVLFQISWAPGANVVITN